MTDRETREEAMAGVRAFVREERKRQGLTQKALGDKAGVRHPTVSDIERGSHNGSMSVVLKLLVALGYTLAVSPLVPGEGGKA
jgi:HTH-type transcriptional regulator/antitoxin HipB